MLYHRYQNPLRVRVSLGTWLTLWCAVALMVSLCVWMTFGAQNRDAGLRVFRSYMPMIALRDTDDCLHIHWQS
jgi:hypothetical protein